MFSWNADAQENADPAGEKPHAYVQFFNATSVEAISVKINGIDFYPKFPKGMKTAGGMFDLLQGMYEFTDLKTGKSAKKAIALAPDSFQTIVFHGDFLPLRKDGKKVEPEQINFNTEILSHELLPKEKSYRYRVLNLLQEKPLRMRIGGGVWETVEAEKLFSFTGQPVVSQLDLAEGERLLQLPIRQDPPYANWLIVVWEEGGKLKYKVLAEKTAEILKTLE